MKQLLITGFDAFGGHTSNPSWEAVLRLPDTVGDYHLQKQLLPTVYKKAAAITIRAAQQWRVDAIICVGLAAGRDAVTPERIGVNIRDARIPDNEGNLCSGEPIAPSGPAAYFSTLPVTEMARAIRDCHIPASVSNTAGTYVCNDVLYSILHRFHNTPIRCGFIHVPDTHTGDAPGLPIETTVQALIAAIGSL